MTTYQVEDSEFIELIGRNILIVGGCTGIGRAAVQLAHGKMMPKVGRGDAAANSALQRMAPILFWETGTRLRARS
jgi:NADPH:quinone reductase-like Zn-dependent oxidoreductase